jgi:hypothetical protein
MKFTKKEGFILAAIFILAIAGGVIWYLLEKQKTTVIEAPKQETASESQNEETFDGQEADQVDTSDWKTYRNEEIGVEFQYPSKWGEIKERKEQGCYDYENGGVNKTILTKEDQCYQIALYTSNYDKAIFFSTQSNLRVKFGIPRGAYWGDYTGAIKSEKDIQRMCEGQKENDCNVYKTLNGIWVAKRLEQREFSPEGEMIYVYYIKSSHPIYFSIAMSADRIMRANKQDLSTESDFSKVIDSLVFLSN